MSSQAPPLSPFVIALFASCAAWATPAFAQAPAPAAKPVPVVRPAPAPPVPGAVGAGDDDEQSVAEVVVTAQRDQVGAVVGDIKPELQLSPADIQSYGVSTVTELLAELAPQTRSDRGRGGEGPVVLLNGRRISAFNEIRDIPTEAILRVDILPEEAALKYGYAANQRVVNIVLRRRFRAITAEAGVGGPTEGGQVSGSGEGDLFRTLNDDRLNLDLKASASSALTEDERNLVSIPVPGAPANTGQFRTLLPDTRSVTANAVISKPLPFRLAGTANATLGATSSDAGQGYLTGFGPLTQTTTGWTAHLGSTLNRDEGKWRYSLTNAYDHADSDTSSDRAAVAGGATRDRGLSQTDSTNIQLLANGPLVELPSGRLFASLKAGDSQNWLSSQSVRGGLTQAVDLSRNTFNAQGNFDLPLASKRNNFLPMFGEFSVNVNVAVDQVSDFGPLTTYGYGANWTPVTGLSLIVSTTHDEAAPTQQQLGGPIVVTPGVRVFDYATGRTVDVTRIDGGTRTLSADGRDVFKLGLTYKPISSQELTFTANYVRSRIQNPIQNFPAATAEVEAAFPNRFVRDASGALTQIDNRPVNFARQDREELRYGFNYSRPVGPQPPPRGRRFGGGAPGDGPPQQRPSTPDADRNGAAPATPPSGDDGPRFGGGGGGPRGGGGGGFGGGPGGGGRLQLALYHTVFFSDQLLVRPGGPVFDLLNGSAAGSTGGQPQHEVEAQAGLTLNNLGARISADWKSGTTVNGAGATGNLDFSDLFTLNLRLFANLGGRQELVKAYPWLRGSRVTFGVSNLFDARIRVRDATGATPVGYQAAYLDPAGRVVRLSLRKLFF